MASKIAAISTRNNASATKTAAEKPFVRQILDVINSVRANPHKIIAAVQLQMS